MREFTKYRYFDDISYKMDFLVSFIEQPSEKKQKYLSLFEPEDQAKIQDFEILFQIMNFDISTRHLEIVCLAFDLLHRIHTRTLQANLTNYFRAQSSCDHEIDLTEESIKFLLQNDESIQMIYQKIKFDYLNHYFANDALFMPAFAFFWGLFDLIHNSRDLLQREVEKLSKKYHNSSDTKELNLEIIQKILQGSFISLDEIMIIKSDLESFKNLVKWRKVIQLELCFA